MACSVSSCFRFLMILSQKSEWWGWMHVRRACSRSVFGVDQCKARACSSQNSCCPSVPGIVYAMLSMCRDLHSYNKAGGCIFFVRMKALRKLFAHQYVCTRGETLWELGGPRPTPHTPPCAVLLWLDGHHCERQP